MSLYIDVKYLNQVGPRISQFKNKGQYLYQCRCPICGDSQKKKNKARGYFYRRDNDLFYKCHNCSASQHFGTFLKNFDQLLYREYALERYAAGENNRPHADPEFKFTAPVFQPQPVRNFLDQLERVDTMPADSEVRQYLSLRNIPEDQLHRLYYIDDIKRIEGFDKRYVNTIQTHEPRLVIPFWGTDGTSLTGLSCRGMRNEALRYITVRANDVDPLIFGYDCIQLKNPIYVTEGPLDSLFLPNAIAVGGTGGFSKLHKLFLDRNQVTLVIDNQPRNSEVCKLYQKMISEGWRVFIWPQYTTAKDINDLVNIGADPKAIIDAHSHQGLTAQLKFNEWKKV